MNAIDIEDVAKSYTVGFRMKRTVAVQRLSLSVTEGEVFGFIGPNGAGKTTTIKMLMGLTWPSSGQVRIFGRSAREVAPKADVGFLPERPYFYQYLTAMEFLEFYGQLFDLPATVRRERARKLLARVGLEASADTPLRKFSKGMLQRVGMAQALINDPKLVVLDEPMSGLDPLGRMMIRDIILELKAEGRTLFFSSHILSDVELICDRVGIIVKGELRQLGALDELLHRRIRHTEITVVAPMVDLPAEVRALATAVTPMKERTLLRVEDPQHTQRLLALLVTRGVPVEAVTPRHDTLEDLFVAQLQEGARAGGTP